MKRIAKTISMNVFLVLSVSAAQPESPLFEEVDALTAKVAQNVEGCRSVAVINHARLAIATGVPMPPSTLTIFSDSVVNTKLVAANPLIGLDLPHKVLVYAEPDATVATIAYADAEFLMKRYGITDSSMLQSYEKTLMSALSGIPEEIREPVKAVGVKKGFGITQMVSSYPMKETINRLKKVIMEQGDTVWFGQVDFQADAAARGVEIPGATLLLFGGPKPGGLAMAEFPRLGLDAFCQKLLVYEGADGHVKIAFNDIVALAQLHYGSSNKPQQVINARLATTFGNAIK